MFGDGASSQEENPFHEYPAQTTGEYQAVLVAFNELGCSDTTSHWISVSEGVLIYVPNSFTPDGDEINPLFLTSFIGDFDAFNFEMIIYDRWGQRVFLSNDVYSGWDGTHGGNYAPSGTYTWVINYKRKENDERQTINGHVNLLR